MRYNGYKTIRFKTLYSIKTLGKKGDKVIFDSLPCIYCGQPVDIEVVKTESGFGFLNGILLESQSGEFFAKCAQCSDVKFSEHINMPQEYQKLAKIA